MLVSNQASLNKVAPTPTPQTMGHKAVNFGASQNQDTVELSTQSQPEEKSFLQKYGVVLALAGAGIVGAFFLKGKFKKAPVSTEKASNEVTTSVAGAQKTNNTKAPQKTEEQKFKQRLRIAAKYQSRADKAYYISEKLLKEKNPFCREYNTKALNFYKKAIAFNPENPYLYCKRGNLFARVGQGDIALHNYMQAIEVAPDFALAHYNVVTVLKDKDPKTALVHAKRVCELMPLDMSYAAVRDELLESVK